MYLIYVQNKHFFAVPALVMSYTFANTSGHNRNKVNHIFLKHRSKLAVLHSKLHIVSTDLQPNTYNTFLQNNCNFVCI